MAEGKKSKYITKSVKFQGKEVTLYSLDGFTWSTRKQELALIKERQERDKVSFAAIKEENGETKVVPKVRAEVADGDDADPEIYDEEDAKELDISDEETPSYAEDDKVPARKGRGRPVVKAKEVPAAKPAKASEVKPAKKPGKMTIVPKKQAVAEKVAPKKRSSGKPAAKKSTKVKAKAKKKAA